MGVTRGIEKQLEEIAQQRSQSSPPALSSQLSTVQPAMPIAAPQVLRVEVTPAPVKAVSPPKRKPLTVESLLQNIAGEQDPFALLGGVTQPPTQDTDVSINLRHRLREHLINHD